MMIGVKNGTEDDVDGRGRKGGFFFVLFAAFGSSTIAE